MEDMKLASITLRTNGTIADAINTYTTMGVPLSQLLTDYNDVITYPDLLETAVNPWESIHIRKGTPVVCGVSQMCLCLRIESGARFFSTFLGSCQAISTFDLERRSHKR